MSEYGDQTHCENLDCVSQLEIGQASFLLNRPRRCSCLLRLSHEAMSKNARATKYRCRAFYLDRRQPAKSLLMTYT